MDAKSFLEGMGFSSYEIKVLLSMMNKESLSANQISKLSKVPTGRVYDVLYSLERKGVISTIISKPKLYKGLTPEDLVEFLLKTEGEKVSRIRSERRGILRALKGEVSLEPKELRNYIHVHFGKTPYYGEAVKFCNDSKKELLWIVAHFTERTTSQAFLRAAKRGVNTRGIVYEVTPANRNNVKTFVRSGGKMRELNMHGLRFGVSDSEKTTIAINDPKNPSGRITIVIESPVFAKSMEYFFNSMWEKAKPIK